MRQYSLNLRKVFLYLHAAQCSMLNAHVMCFVFAVSVNQMWPETKRPHIHGQLIILLLQLLSLSHTEDVTTLCLNPLSKHLSICQLAHLKLTAIWHHFLLFSHWTANELLRTWNCTKLGYLYLIKISNWRKKIMLSCLLTWNGSKYELEWLLKTPNYQESQYHYLFTMESHS